MAIKSYKPTTPTRRYATVSTYEEITKTKPEKSLVTPIKKSGGRNNQGHITCRHRGGGNKRMLRIIDFKRNKVDVPGKCASIEYDPNRSARIALINYADGEKRYILWPLGLKVGAAIIASETADIQPGNCMMLSTVPLGTIVHNVEMTPGKGGQMVRSAGSGAQVMAKEGKYVTLRLPSGEMRNVLAVCKATIGQLGNVERANIKVGKAGRNRWLGWRPHVRGTVMNPIDHPHGGGEGKTKGGRIPVTPWGKPTKGYKTRRNKRTTKFIVKRRG